MKSPKKAKVKNNIHVYASEKSGTSILFPIITLVVGSVAGYLWGRHTAKVDENAKKGRLGPTSLQLNSGMSLSERKAVYTTQKEKLSSYFQDQNRKDMLNRMSQMEINDLYWYIFESQNSGIDNVRKERLTLLFNRYPIAT
jgi:hypothetical protein